MITSGKLVPAALRSILSLSYAELRELADRHLAAGWCLRWLTLTEAAGQWAPAASLGDVFKVLDPARLEAIAAALRLGGFEVLEDGRRGVTDSHGREAHTTGDPAVGHNGRAGVSLGGLALAPLAR